MLENVLAAWRLSPSRHEPERPASAKELEEAQAALGRRLPEAAIALYDAHGGGSFVGRNLGIHPSLGEGPEDDQSPARPGLPGEPDSYEPGLTRAEVAAIAGRAT